MKRLCLLLVQKSWHDQNMLYPQLMRHVNLLFCDTNVSSVSQIVKLIDTCHFHIMIPECLINPVIVGTEPFILDINTAYSGFTAASHDLIQRSVALRLIDRLYYMIIKHRQPDRIDVLFLQRHLHRCAVQRPSLPFNLRAPVNRIDKNPLNLRHMVNWILLMPRLKIEDSAKSALECAAAPEYLTARKPACKHHIIRLWNVKILAVHLLNRNVKVCRNALCDRMVRRGHKQPLAVAMTPAKCHACPHEQAHNFRKMRRMQRDQPHSLQHMAFHALRHLVGKLMMRHMSPVNQHIRIRKNRLGQTMLRLLQSGSAHQKIPVLLQEIRNTAVDSMRIDLSHFLLSLLMQIFVPYSYSDHISPPGPCDLQFQLPKFF